MIERRGTMITEMEQATLDIDWFFTNGKEIAFVASGGGKLPGEVSKSKENIENLALYFRSLPKSSDVIINSDLNKIMKAQEINESYLADFIMMAEKGFFSYDKTILNNFSEANYHLVVRPINPLKTDDLPLDISKILMTTERISEMEANFDTNLI